MNGLIKTIDVEYQKGNSAKEIADKLGLKENKIRYWMAKGGVRPRSWSEATYCKRNPGGDPYQIPEERTSPTDLELFFLGIALYLGEGTKKGKHNVALANSDPRIIKLFILFLKRICNVRESKITAELNLFDDIIIEDVLTYWRKNTGLKASQFRKSIVRKSKGGTYKNKSKYGTLSIKVFNSKLKSIILTWCNNALKKYS